MMDKSVYIIILNWNRWEDTVECLESIQQLRHNNYRMVLVDNGSSDDSLKQIKSWASGKFIVKSRYVNYLLDNKNIRIVEYDNPAVEEGEIVIRENNLLNYPSGSKLIIIKNNDNLGFAGGCNVGIRYALASGADYIWLLNNDTVVDQNCLVNFVPFLERHSDYSAVTGQIRLYHDPSKIWHCGGKLTWYGTVKYNHANDFVKSLPQHGIIRITFVSGCAVLFRSSVFKEIGLLSERFFFGEEDFELSLRMKKTGYKIACLYDSIIYHKVGATVGLLNQKRILPRVYIYYINRFINMRGYMAPPVWHLWRLAYIFYIVPMLMIRYKISLNSAITAIIKIQQDSIALNKVDKKTFERYMGLDID